MKKTGESDVATCPSCDTKIRFEEPPHLGQTLDCPECGNTLEVVRRNPLELDWVFDLDDSNDDEDDEAFFDDDDDDDDWFDDDDENDDGKW